MVQYPSDHIGTNQSIDGDDVSVELKGKYELAKTNDVIQLLVNGEGIEVAWHSDEKKVKKNNKHYCIDKELVKVILNKMRRNNTTELGEERTKEGYTRATATTKDGNRVIFYSHPHFQGRKWYYWTYVHFEEITAFREAAEKYYPTKILGFITISGTPEAVTQCSEKPLIWSDLEKIFFEDNCWY